MPDHEGPPAGVGVHGGPDHLVLYPTWTGLLAASLVPPGLLLLGWLAIEAGSTGAIASVLLVGGTVSAVLAGRDFPRHVLFGPEGIERRCLLRRHLLPYTEVTAIRRAPASRFARARAARSGDPAERARVRSGLFAAGPGRRRWMLTDQPESREEYDRLATLLIVHGPTSLEAGRPPAGTPPTSLYRRRPPPLAS
jgi:hypothetical protein